MFPQMRLINSLHTSYVQCIRKLITVVNVTLELLFQFHIFIGVFRKNDACLGKLHILIFSLKEPEFSYYLAFKYLTYANFNGLKASLVLTKADKSNEKEIEEIKAVFSKMNIPVYATSSKANQGLDDIKSLFKDKISVLIGQSGVGKSSLLNAIDESYEREIGEYSLALGRGKHKTKEVILLPYQNGYIADTPGFSSLELEMNKLEVAQHFPAFEKDALECFYSNCLHISEKNCKIKDKVTKGEIPQIAYENYLKLLEEVERY